METLGKASLHFVRRMGRLMREALILMGMLSA